MKARQFFHLQWFYSNREISIADRQFPPHFPRLRLEVAATAWNNNDFIERQLNGRPFRGA
jgi:hypothetical protein